VLWVDCVEKLDFLDGCGVLRTSTLGTIKPTPKTWPKRQLSNVSTESPGSRRSGKVTDVMTTVLQALALRAARRNLASDTISRTVDIKSSEMPSKTALICLLLAMLHVVPASVHADDFRSPGDKRWWQGEWKEEYWDGPCQVKSESKRGEFKREIKCKNGIGADWRGEWKSEFRDGPCLVKQDVKRDEFKEEVKCERRRQ
jgi:hypothetical protein